MPQRLLRLLLLVVVPLVLALAALHWYAKGARYAETDNAYVKAQVIPISAEVSGRVAEVPVRDQQRVERGALLFRLDPVPFQLARARAEAQLSVVRAEIETLRAEYRSARVDADEQSERIPFLERQLERQRRMKEKGMSREDLYDEAQNTLETGKTRLAALRERANRALAALNGKPDAPAEAHPRFLEALAMLDAAKLDLERTSVSAPAAGVVSNMKLRPGEFVERGAAKFSLVEEGMLWVEANYKETQLTDMREGQAASLSADAYPGIAWRARVTTIGAATGAEFAVLPPQNATGNWVKVVQRIPVRVAIDDVAGKPPLRAGMTVTVSVDTGRDRGAFDLLRGFFGPAQAQSPQ
ncbi:MAG TPA: HlyD family secretion protein [Burkholderiales bacterium]|nr:HlyD family secretion protein [Burkholderiales bacterium]